MRKLITVLLLLAAVPAFGHPGHVGGSGAFLSGFAHPFTGLDHLLAMFAVGLWSAMTTRRVWLAPVCFACVLLIGALLSANDVVLPASEPMIAASVLVLGLLIMTHVRFPEPAVAMLVACFALFHGAAHGTELGISVALLGVLTATLFLHAGGIVIGLATRMHHPWWQRGMGVGIAMIGVGLARAIA